MKLRLYLALFVILLLTKNCFSQTDTSFWFAAPDISSDFSYDRPVMFRITSAGQLCNVTIEQPAGGGMPVQNIIISPNSTQSLDLTPWLSFIECAPGNLVQNKGLKIKSDNKISVYYEVNVGGPNPELFALKGKNALGQQFYISSQYFLSNSSTYTPRPYSSFNIVATDDNTQVTINPSQDIVGHTANTPFTITLNKGQTFAAIASSQLKTGHLQGSSVNSTKPIAITLSDDLLSGAEYGGVCADLAGDQTVPVNVVGNEYIAFKSSLNSPFDKLYITATQNNTIVTQDGTNVTTINSGQTTELSISNNITYIQTTLPVYAYQLSGYGCEAGSAILPKISCTGSSSVSVTRSTNETFTVTLLVKSGGQNTFLVNGAAGVINGSSFSTVPGTGGQWYYAKITLPVSTFPNGSVINISNNSSVFQEGVLQGDVSGVGFGYFSDFNTISARASAANSIVCKGAAIQLIAETVPSATYSWTGPGSFSSTQQNPVISNSALQNSGYYYLTINVPGCGTSIDSLNILVNDCGSEIGSVINNYTPVLNWDPCKNSLIVGDANGFFPGDTILLIQMKGAIIDSTNTAAFGTISDYKNAGNYEINYIKSITGNIIDLKNSITRLYDIPDGKVQLVRVPYYQKATVTSTLTCLPWDGSKGGVLVLNAADTIFMNADIDVSGTGFKGGNGFNSQQPILNCDKNDYYYPQSNIDIAGQKGESIAVLSEARNYGKGSPANGGGGGLGHNSGGGGGSNAGTGGFGGYQLDRCGNAPFDNRGIGGKTLTTSSTVNRLFLGGGGGAGQADNPGNPAPSGGNGGGIVIIIGDKLKSNGHKIFSNGNNSLTCSTPPSTDCHDAMGGGGGGGSVILNINQYIGNVSTETKGGNGADMVGSVPLGGRIGPGGGGGGGSLFVKNASLPAAVQNTNTGGINGVLTQDANNPWGTTPGVAGAVYTGFSLQVDNTPFRPNIDSVRIKDSLLTCNDYDFKGLGFTNTQPVTSWYWTFGDGGTANTQNPRYTYNTAGIYPVKLVVTDANGCKDSISLFVNPSFLTTDAGPADTICQNNSTTLQGYSSGGVTFSWQPAAYLNNPALLNPVATPPTTTVFYLTATNAAGCSMKDSVTIEVRSSNGFSINPPSEICLAKSVNLFATGGDIYAWSPSASLNNPAIPTPVASPLVTTIYTVNIKDTLCAFSTNLTTTVTVHPLPLVKAAKSNDIDCIVPSSRLSATGASTYTWLPVTALNNPLIANPTANPVITTQYFVTGTDAFGCDNKDSITVKVSADNPGSFLMPTAFTPNNDGLNDCYGIKYWGRIQQLEFSIYNRWGERVFFTKDPNACWDGTVHGVKQNGGVFVYMIKANTSCQSQVFRKGTFALIR